LKDLRKNISNDNLLIQIDNSVLPDDLLVLIGQNSKQSLRSSHFSKPRNTVHTRGSDDGDSIWVGLKNLQ